MTTKKEYKKNLENGIITEEMLELVVQSLSKRAKNCRDQAEKYRNTDYFEQYKQKQDEYYEQKDFLLKTLLKPICIHKESYTKEVKEKIYSYEERYWQYERSPKVIYRNCYYDKERDDIIDFIVIMKEEDIVKYYLYYKTKNYSYHLPIDDPSRYPNLEIIQIGKLKTYGEDIKKLASVQFCKKLIELVKSGNYKYIPNE